MDALNNQISLNAGRGMTLDSFFSSYSPAAAGNDPVGYAQNVAGWMGIDPTVSLSTLNPGQLYANGGGFVSGDGSGNGSGLSLDDLSNLGLDPAGLLMGLDFATMPIEVLLGLGAIGVYLISKL